MTEYRNLVSMCSTILLHLRHPTSKRVDQSIPSSREIVDRLARKVNPLNEKIWFFVFLLPLVECIKALQSMPVLVH